MRGQERDRNCERNDGYDRTFPPTARDTEVIG